MIYNWSFSRLMSYEKCPHLFKLKAIDRLPEPPRPPDNPLERGNRVHNGLEAFVKGEGAIPHEVKPEFKTVLHEARELYASGMATTEDDWFFDKDWNPCTKKDIWLWAKLDLNVIDEENRVSIIVDYKTGGMTKVVEHSQQGQLYAATAALRQPWAERIEVEFWYTDQGQIRPRTYSREEALSYVGRFQARVDVLYNDRFFRARPSKANCHYCPYGVTVGTGACAFAFRG